MGKMPEVIFVNWLSWKRSNTHAYQISPPCIVWCASLRSEEAVIGKVPEAHFCQWLPWKRSNTHVYQVSPPCIAWFASLRSKEVVTGKSAKAIFCSWSSWKLKYTSFTSIIIIIYDARHHAHPYILSNTVILSPIGEN